MTLTLNAAVRESLSKSACKRLKIAETNSWESVMDDLKQKKEPR
jgi:hypothetical protein